MKREDKKGENVRKGKKGEIKRKQHEKTKRKWEVNG
jgi:hypothetical protein